MGESLFMTNHFVYSNHIMTNQERMAKNIRLLSRSHELDELARSYAEEMAEKDHVIFHHHHQQQQQQHGEDHHHHQQQQHLQRLFGENVAKGHSIEEIHRRMMETDFQRMNILNDEYMEMGMAVARSTKHDGEIFLCQLYRGGNVVATTTSNHHNSPLRLSFSTTSSYGDDFQILRASRKEEMYFI